MHTLLPGDDDPQHKAELFHLIYPDLRRIASFHMRGERRNMTLQATCLVHEAFLKLCRQLSDDVCRDRQYLLAVASQAMRRILVDRARARLAAKRDQPLETPFHGFASTAEFMELHEALDRLAVIDYRQAQIVEMRFFGGLTEEEIASALGICARTVKRDWRAAKAWLYGELQ